MVDRMAWLFGKNPLYVQTLPGLSSGIELMQPDNDAKRGRQVAPVPRVSFSADDCTI
jgi:hypothetical protein